MEPLHHSSNNQASHCISDKNRPETSQDSDCVWIEQAAFDGITEAQILLGLLYEGGLIGPFLLDFHYAKSWYLTAAAADHPHARFHLYRLKRRGAVIGEFCTDVLRQGLITAANAGHSLAQFQLGQDCEAGMVDDSVCQDASYWYGMASTAGLPAAQYALGQLALKHVSEDPRGKRWAADGFMQAACFGHEPAETRVCGFARKDLFDPAQWREVEAWYKSLARNADNPVAAYVLSQIYAAGLGRQKDASRSEFWLARAGACGHAVAQYTLGSRYEHGTEVRRDLRTAHLWYHQAAERGYLPAELADGRLIESGELPCFHTLDEAMELYLRASPRSVVALARYVRLLIHKKSDGRLPLSAMSLPTWLQADDKWIIDDWLE